MKKTHFYRLFSAHNNLSGRTLYIFGIMIMFWTIFDSLITYIIPIALTNSNFSKTTMGLIIGSSSIFGAIFDIIISRYVKDIDYKKIIFWMFLLCASIPLLLLVGKYVLIFLLAMIVWGVYYDLYNFGTLDFVAETTKPAKYSESFGVIEVFKGFSGVIAPLIAGFLIVDVLNAKVYSAVYLFLAAGFLVFLALIRLGKKIPKQPAAKFDRDEPLPKNFIVETKLWKKITWKIWPVLLMTTFLSMIASFFWTIGPLYSEVNDLGIFNGAFVFASALPSLLLGWFVSRINKNIGKKYTAFWATLAGSLILLLLFVNFNNPWTTILIVFAASMFFAISFPSIAAAYEDYISENSLAQAEIQSIQDFFTNLGFIIGPITAGWLADNKGINETFGYLGIIGAVLMIVFLLATPRHINIGIKPKDFKS